MTPILVWSRSSNELKQRRGNAGAVFDLQLLVRLDLHRRDQREAFGLMVLTNRAI